MISRLSEGEETVSKLATSTGLRMPHASAEIRRMREDGLVTSNLPMGSRGSKIRLTESGWATLQDDERFKALQIQKPPSDRESCCVAFRDEDNILLCLLAPPSESIVPIPCGPWQLSEGTKISTRNTGVSWNWAVLMERSARWFDLKDMSRLEEPPELAAPDRIDAYFDKPPAIGLIRAKLLDNNSNQSIVTGQWFSTDDFQPSTPFDEPNYHRGLWTLGSSHSMLPDVRPKQPIVAVTKERIAKSILLRSAKSGALVVADLGGIDKSGDLFPIRALEHWIKLAHPRLSGNERKKRLGSLKLRFSSARKSKIDASTWRRFRKDWGSSEFTEDESEIRLIDIRGLGGTAVESLVRWSLEGNNLPLVLELSQHIPSDLHIEVATHQRARLIMLDSFIESLSDLDQLVNDDIRPVPWMKLRTKAGQTFPVRLLEKFGFEESTIVEESPISPWKLLGIEEDFISENLDPESLSMVRSAVSQFPDGNEEWANQIEARYPLASWIATPNWARWPRWQRISEKVEQEWMVLLDTDHLPIDKISSLAQTATDPVLNLFGENITAKLQQDPDNLIRSWPAIDPSEADRGSSWLASKFIENSPWLPEESHEDLLGWALEAWLSDPPDDSIPALRGLSWLLSFNNKESEFQDSIINRVLLSARKLPDGHKLGTWAKLFDHSKGLDRANLATFQLFRTDLPYNWWAPISSEMLSSFLKEDNLSKLLEYSSPWSAVILRPGGEICQAPGLSDIRHPGCDPGIFPTLEVAIRKIESRDEQESAASLIDLYQSLQAIKNSSTPSSGHTHPLVGWLAQPIDKWPSFTMEKVMEGDHSVSERLILKKSGFFEGIF